MKKETVLAAVVFFALGFLAGYITDAQMNWRGRPDARAKTTSPQSATDPANIEGGRGLMQGLPEGHPPIDTTSVIKRMEEEVRQSPNDTNALLRLANFLYDQGQYQQTIEWYQKLLAIDPKNVNARTDMGTAYFFLGQPQRALKEYAKSLAIEPGHKATLVNLIVVNLEGTHDIAAAQRAWDRLHQIDPSFPALQGLRQKLDAARAAQGTPSVP